MTLELPIAMLSCARIGAVHAVVFAGFSTDALAARICQTGARILITGDGYYRGKKLVALKMIADNALIECSILVSMHSSAIFLFSRNCMIGFE